MKTKKAIEKKYNVEILEKMYSVYTGVVGYAYSYDIDGHTRVVDTPTFTLSELYEYFECLELGI